MRTKVVIFKVDESGLSQELGCGKTKSLNHYLKEGWTPTKWDLIGYEPTRFRVVLERDTPRDPRPA